MEDGGGRRSDGVEGVIGTTTLVDLVNTRALTFPTTSIRVTTSFLLKGMFPRIPTDTFLDLAVPSDLRPRPETMDHSDERYVAGCSIVGRGGAEDNEEEDNTEERRITW